MNLLTLLRTNKYTQKQMGFLLGIPSWKVSKLVLKLESRGYIQVNRRYKLSGPVSRPFLIYDQNLYKVTLYRSKECPEIKVTPTKEQSRSRDSVGRGLRNFAKHLVTGCLTSIRRPER
ncbi:helix-turn-helix DNA-binding domain-containing protein [Escherichia phage 4MG]|uniref:Helix-turn-helix DNA-binding domain-containing protein n=1 Tax=Escherichia phage 4MG TaxID=1391428 RepID=V5KSG5_9CAUD|nr:helix-turn-helix DNA-binding domain-containing protein [Escherichia phage 4MG]AGZ17719.1 helix-turn-helix DNA-binding domain-containing protein [Escherichia phage 4MG]